MSFDFYWSEWLHTTLFSMLGFCCSIFFGMILAVFLFLPVSFLHKSVLAIVEMVKSVPVPVLLLTFYFGLPALGFSLSGFKAGTIGLCIYTGLMIGERIYQGIRSIPRGQLDVALGTGLTYTQTMKYVIFPQIVSNTLPPLGNQFIQFIKYSSLLVIVAAIDFILSLYYNGS